MLGRIVEITISGARVALERGFIKVSTIDRHLGEIPLDEIEAVITSTPAATYTSQALAALAARGAPVVICGTDFAPAAFLLPMRGHYAQGDRMEAQATASRPCKKRLWSQIVRAKVRAQAAALEVSGCNPRLVLALISRIRSGDPDNIEARAAQRYLREMFGRSFSRSTAENNVNNYLNYGYTVLRAAAARSIVAAGLHPSLSIHHKSGGDPLRLADDLMEPFRPAVDLVAMDLQRKGAGPLDSASKRQLAAVLHADYATKGGVTTLSNALTKLSQSLAQVYLGERRDLSFPLSPIPLRSTGANCGNSF